VARAAGAPVIASGGVGSLADVRALAALPALVSRASSSGGPSTRRVTLADALAAARGA
jgi:phosphoribosylformimino-5-aminoimidazole carboxamide ribonucleotide (ProFAR) isomerase